MSDLFLLLNEKIFKKKNIFFCENKDIQSIVNYFSLKHNLFIISRYSKFIKPFKLNKYAKIFNFKFSKIFHLFKFFFYLNNNKKKILMISITPFNFFIFLIFKFFFNSKFYVYLRSNGYEEYRVILGQKYVWIYDFMFKYVAKYCEIISCHEKLYHKSCHILYPSELNSNWINKTKVNHFKNDVISILYVGRFKIEKGIYSLLDIFSQFPKNIELKLVGSGDDIKKINNKVKIVNFVNNEKKLIKLYDSANIVILPSFTEAHPKVIDEALARMRPVIVFDDIKHVINNRFGVFSVQRDTKKLIQLINFIKKNNNFLYSKLKKNNLPQKEKFLKDLNEIVSVN